MDGDAVGDEVGATRLGLQRPVMTRIIRRTNHGLAWMGRPYKAWIGPVTARKVCRTDRGATRAGRPHGWIICRTNRGLRDGVGADRGWDG